MTNFLLDFTDSATDAEVTEYLTTNGCTVIQTYSNLNKVYLVTASAALPTTSIVTSITDDSAINITPMAAVAVAPAVHNSVTFDTTDEKQWWKIYSASIIDLSGASVSFDIHETLDVDTYIVDSGILASHPEFAGQNLELLYSVTPNDFTDATGHGTGIASLITGNTCGINKSSVKIIKIFDPAHTTLQSDLLSAFNAIIGKVLATPGRLSIVNLSWAIPRNAYVEQKIQLLIDLGIKIVAAAGNNGVPIENVTPAAMAKVMTVGAYNQDFSPCAFSDYQSSTVIGTPGDVNNGHLDMWAPGARINVASIDGGYAFAAGTSFAAGIVSAAIAYNSLTKVQGVSTVGLLSTPWSNLMFSKQGLLNLSDPKYASNTNVVISLLNLNDYSIITRVIPEDKAVSVVVNQSKSLQLFNIDTTTHYELSQPLPNFMQLIGTALFVYPTTEPVSQTGIDKYEFDITVTPITGNVYTNRVTVYVVSSTMDLTTFTVVNPTIPAPRVQDRPVTMTFLSAYSTCGWSSQFGGSCQGNGCNTCAGGKGNCICYG
jgi:hypothetical protein